MQARLPDSEQSSLPARSPVSYQQNVLSPSVEKQALFWIPQCPESLMTEKNKIQRATEEQAVPPSLSPPSHPHFNHSAMNYETLLTEIFSMYGAESPNEPDVPTGTQGSQLFLKK